jgi:hypothetical protein
VRSLANRAIARRKATELTAAAGGRAESQSAVAVSVRGARPRALPTPRPRLTPARRAIARACGGGRRSRDSGAADSCEKPGRGPAVRGFGSSRPAAGAPRRRARCRRRLSAVRDRRRYRGSRAGAGQLGRVAAEGDGIDRRGGPVERPRPRRRRFPAPRARYRPLSRLTSLGRARGPIGRREAPIAVWSTPPPRAPPGAENAFDGGAAWRAIARARGRTRRYRPTRQLPPRFRFGGGELPGRLSSRRDGRRRRRSRADAGQSGGRAEGDGID